MDFVSIIMGSKSDYKIMSECIAVLESFGIPYEMLISSAHRSPERTRTYIQKAEAKGAKVFIAAAGMAAHLAGAIAGMTIRPVIGVPLPGGAIDGLDALLSTVQMPSGIPVGTLAIGKAGAMNAGYLAAQILSLNNPILTQKLKEDREKKLAKLEADSREIEVFL